MKPETQIAALWALVQRIVETLPEGGQGGTEYVMKMHGHAAHVAEAAKMLRELHVTRSPTETDAAHLKRVSTAAQKFVKDIENTQKVVQKISEEGRAHLQARINAKVKLKPDAYESEVRAVFRNLPHAERLKLLGELIEQGRGAEFAAIVKAPRTLTGLTEEMCKHFEHAFVARHAEAELLDRGALDETAEALDVAIRTAREFADTYHDPAKLVQITQAEEAAAKAAQAFHNTVSVRVA